MFSYYRNVDFVSQFVTRIMQIWLLCKVGTLPWMENWWSGVLVWSYNGGYNGLESLLDLMLMIKPLLTVIGYRLCIWIV